MSESEVPPTSIPNSIASHPSMASESSTSSASQQITDVPSPFFLHSADHPSAVLVSTPLNNENYLTWKRAMKMALNAKNKLGFIDSSITKPTKSQSDAQLWDRCNDMVLSWILNSIDKNLVTSLISYTMTVLRLFGLILKA